MKPSKAIAAYIKDNCANYDRDGMCLLNTTEDSRLCPFIYDLHIVCKYGKESVLAGAPDIYAEYKAQAGETELGKVCADCGRSFDIKSNRQTRCTDCGVLHRKRKRQQYNVDYQIRKQKNG